MPSRHDRVTENQVAFAICQIAKTAPSGTVSFARCKREVPDHLALSAADREQSPTRRNEELWEQQIRNIKSHSATEGNYICEGYLIHVPGEGYQITDAGRARKYA
jgi:hypothetical protein